ncbi:hypothetical protein CF635_003526 [Enterobacter hormaechei]|nr:hypothetical protein [Enterobacter hormaechei]
MQLLSTQAQRNLEVFIKYIGIKSAIISDEMSFNLVRHDLYISATGQKLTFMLVSKRSYHAQDLKNLAARVSPDRHNGKISRVFLLDTLLAVHFSINDDVQAEEIYQHYQKIARYF